MASRLVELLVEVRRSVESVASTQQEANRTRKAAHELFEAIQRHKRAPIAEACLPRLREEMLELAAAMIRLEPSLTAALHPPPGSAEDADTSYAPDQLYSCSLALGACAGLESARSLLGRDSYRFAAAAQLVLQAGRTYLVTWPALQAAGALVGRTLQADVSWMETHYQDLCSTQLCTVVNIVGSVQRAGGVEAAFAASTARPAVLLPWWRAITQALLAVPLDPRPNGPMSKALLSYTQLALGLTSRPEWAKHAEQLAADALLCTAVVDVLLTRSLPALAAHAAGDSSLELVLSWASGISISLCSPSLDGARHKRLHHNAGVAAAASNAVVSLVRALPTARPADVAPDRFAELWAAAMMLACWCAVAARADAADGSSSDGGSIASEGSGGSTAGSAAGGSGGSSTGEGSRGSVAGGTAGSSRWECAPLAALPRLMQALQGLADDPNGPPAHPRGAPGWSEALVSLCRILGTAMQGVHSLFASPPPKDCYVSLLETAAAGLRLQPVLARLHVIFTQLPQPAEGEDLRGAAELLSHILFVTLWDVPINDQAWPADAAAHASCVAAHAAEHELHSRAARFVHWLAAGGSLRWAAEPDLIGELFYALHQVLSHTFELSMAHHRAAGSEALLDMADARAMCVTQVEAAQAAIAASCAGSGSVQFANAAAAWTANCLAPAAAAMPALATPTLLNNACIAVAPLAQHASELVDLTTFSLSLVTSAMDYKHLAVPLLNSGLLELIVDCCACARASSSINERDTACKVTRLLAGCDCFLGELAAACTWSDEEAAAQGIPATLLQQAAAAADALREAKAAVPSLPTAEPAELARQMQQLLPAVRQAVTVVQQYWELPAQQQTARLARARAAAGRSCAYLRCANVAAAGGPDAGPGGGSKCCSACRAVWYCSPACQRADWRGGHKHVCPVFIEERQRRKEEQRAARAARQAQQAQEQ